MNASMIDHEDQGMEFKVEYKSLPGLDHGEIIGGSMPDVFNFFNRHTKSK